jgi:hypothetical protein
MVLVLAYYDYGLGTISNGPIEVQLGNPLGQQVWMCVIVSQSPRTATLFAWLFL